jgi:glycine/D-amino acid oxidase-like deaminating enzyme/nitrite reductase/ring-hydroxylating ferredoxin subunit
MLKRDGHQRSVWQGISALDVPAQALPEDVLDVLVVGAGITGVSTALALQQAGQKCLLVDAVSICYGTTGGTSAHINTLLELTYDRMIDKFGEDDARMVAQAASEAFEMIRDNAATHAPECNWQQRDAYMVALDRAQAKELEKVVEGTRAVGLQMEMVDDAPYPGKYVAAARVGQQAQFHPTRYVQGLARAYLQAGGLLRESCPVRDVEEEGEVLVISTNQGILHARHLVYATHVPPGVNILHFRNAPYRSYVLAARLTDEAVLPHALVYDMEDPYHYYRTEEVDGQRLLIAGGCDHKTGHMEDTTEPFEELELHVRALYPVESITHRWSSQYYEPTDGLPYIGKLPMGSDRIMVATGYSGNGMTYGTLAARIITDLITTGASRYAALFDPARVSLVAGFSNFMKEAADVVGQLAAAPFPESKLEQLHELTNGDGRVVRYDKRSVALYRDDEGAFHAVEPACSHIKCIVAWNKAERSWDCPCHGSRFGTDGEVLTGPARKALQHVHLSKDDDEGNAT